MNLFIRFSEIVAADKHLNKGKSENFGDLKKTHFCPKWLK